MNEYRSDYSDVISLIQHTGKYPMIGVTCIKCEYHHLYVFVGCGECVQYTFRYNANDPMNDRLIDMSTHKMDFDTTLISLAHDVLRDGYAHLEVIPQN